METNPDLIIGVDFGMTFTGVAFVNSSALASQVASTTRGARVHCVQQWPGRAQAYQSKVPTTLSYDQGANIVPVSNPRWGFHAEDQRLSPSHKYCCWFKTYLDPDILEAARQDDPEHTPTLEEVWQWTEDYLRQLYTHIKIHLSLQHLPPLKTWETAIIDFVFTMPTTWDTRVVAKFDELVKNAGWSACRSHTVTMGLTEAEAAAVHAACEGGVILSDDEVILVCDAGGGTTDISVLQVTGVQRGVPELKQLMAVSGETIGSTHIDGAFAKFALARLREANELKPLLSAQGVPIDLEDAAWVMTRSEQFQDNKCSCGWPDNTDFMVPIPELLETHSGSDHKVWNGQLRVTQEELRRLFDSQVQALFRLIDQQLLAFAEQYPDEEIARLVLSGGLGKSSYVQQKLQEKYLMHIRTSPTTRMTVHVSTEPQLAVCKGVCHDRLGRLRDGRSVLGTRFCRASYGTETKIPYDPKDPSHRWQKTERDPHDKKLYIKQGVEWFIKKGEPINVDEPIVRRFSRKVKPGDPRDAFRFCDKIITSKLNSDKLPITFSDKSKAEELCKLTFSFSPEDEKRFKRKNRHWWQFGEEYMRVEYEIRVKLGAADVTFQLYFDDVQISDDRPIAVEFVTRTDSIEGNRETNRYNVDHDAPVTQAPQLKTRNSRMWQSRKSSS